MSTREKRSVRALQSRTGWTYSECLRVVRARMTEAEIEALIERRALRAALDTRPATGEE